MPPSIEALERHWLSFGWVIDDDDRVTVDWDSCENMKAVKNTVSFPSKGCPCQTGCQTKRCRCIKLDDTEDNDAYFNDTGEDSDDSDTPDEGTKKTQYNKLIDCE
uniref:Tesmin/TSO1-like CXC domain-containing protein n=1 Tax=Amphimedon queenslandica TaxID=400682 RepID=A0A1X7UEF8_AMPQE